jgi:predicted DNA binding CopG/RHH family protein
VTVRPVQRFSDAYLVQCRAMTPDQIAQFLEDFRELQGARLGHQRAEGSTLISLRVPKPLLRLFRARAAAAGVAYQTQVKRLMAEWVGAADSPPAPQSGKVPGL